MNHSSRSAAEDFRARVAYWVARIGVVPKRVQLQRMTKKWASCSTSGRVCFSTDLLAQDPAFQELVIVHELLHLQVPNHGKLFKGLLRAYLPGWECIAEGRLGRSCGYEKAAPNGRPRPRTRDRGWAPH